jgi:hypothetical protein
MRTMLIVLLLLFFALPLTAVAQTTQKEFAIVSFEDTSCGAWVRSQSSSSARQVYLYWFRGFVSGYNYGNPSYQIPLGAMPDPETLTLYIDKFCRDKPLLPFINAAFRLVDEQRVKQGK